jgi:hypothetical protein
LVQVVHLTQVIEAALVATHQSLVFQLHHLAVVVVGVTVQLLKTVLLVVLAAAVVLVVVLQARLAQATLVLILQ